MHPTRNEDLMTTKIQILLRDSTTEKEESTHAKSIDIIPADQICVVYFGGGGTKTPKEANGYIKTIRQTLNYYSLDVPAYSVVYEFDNNYDSHREVLHNAKRKDFIELNETNAEKIFNNKIIKILSNQSKKISIHDIEKQFGSLRFLFKNQTDESRFDTLLKNALTDLKYTKEEIDQINKLVNRRKIYISSEHITDLYNRIIAPRISTNGKKLEITDALRQIRKITFVSHCYGAVIARKLQDETKIQMLKLGYTDSEIRKVLDQMLIISHEPAGNLSDPSKAFFNFASASDDEMENQGSWLKGFIRSHIEEDRSYMVNNDLTDMDRTWFPRLPSTPSTAIAFLPQRMGNLFLIPQGYPYSDDFIDNEEHNNVRGYITKYPGQNINATALNLLARSVLVNGVKNSFEQKNHFIPLPAINDLVQVLSTNNPKSKEHRNTQFAEMQEIGQQLIQASFKYAQERTKKLMEKKKIEKSKHTSDKTNE